MADFELMAEREDIVRPDDLDPGVGPDPVATEGGETPGATPLGGETPLGLTIPELPVLADEPTFAFDPGVIPGSGFNYEFGLFI